MVAFKTPKTPEPRNYQFEKKGVHFIPASYYDEQDNVIDYVRSNEKRIEKTRNWSVVDRSNDFVTLSLAIVSLIGLFLYVIYGLFFQ